MGRELRARLPEQPGYPLASPPETATGVQSMPAESVSAERAQVQPWALVGLLAAVRFCVHAESSPGLLPRLIQPFARRDLAPDGFTAERRGTGVRVDIVMGRMPAEMVHLVEGNLRQVVGVTSVTMRQEITGAVRRQAA
jgi:hypothetical protein